MLKYHGNDVLVTRTYKVEGVMYGQVRDVQTGEIKTIVLDGQVKKTPKMVRFEKDGQTNDIEYGSARYEQFLQRNRLAARFVDNCLNGVIKTHKGFEISYLN